MFDSFDWKIKPRWYAKSHVAKMAVASFCARMRVWHVWLTLARCGFPMCMVLSIARMRRSWLWSISPGADGNWTQAGQQLGQMHLANVGKRYGVADDFWIGGTRFQGGWSDDWCEWLSEHCLSPLVRSCRDQGVLNANECTSIGRVIDALPNIVPSDPTPSLLHGDLWQGNLHVMQCGTVAFIDPASWVGDPMVDLGMVSLFGGLPAGFVQAWRASGIDHTSGRERIAAGQLLHLLNHVRLFGRSYVPGVLERVDQLT